MYRPTAAGHAAREAPREVEQEDIGEIVESARTFLDDQNADYDRARGLAEGVTTTVADAGLLAIVPALRAHPEYPWLGIFISVLWNRCPETFILYPHDTPRLNLVGKRLAKEKTLLITGRIGRRIGERAEGTIILTQEAGGDCGEYYSTGLFITENGLAHGVLFRGTHLQPGHFVPEIGAYARQLLDCARERPERFTQEFGDGAAIRKRYDALMGRRR